MSSKIEYFSENINHLQVVICDLCQKYFNGKIPYEQHLQSKNHKKKQQEKILLEKMEMKIHQPVLTKDAVNAETGMCNYSMVGDTIPTKEMTETFHFKQPERYLTSDDKVERLTSSFPVSTKKMVCTGHPIHSLLSSGSYYDRCNMCMKNFSSAEAAQLHFASQEHKTKMDTHRQVELILNRYREMNLAEPSKFCNQVDKPKLTENAIASENLTKQSYTDPSFPVKVLNTNEQRIHPKFNFYSQGSKGMLDKMPPVDLPMTNSMETSHYASKSNEQKTFPGCDICGIKSFVTLNASFNHSLTLEHCRKFAMYSKTSEPHTFSESYTPSTLCTNSPITSNCLNNDDQFKLPTVKFHVIPPRISVFGNSDGSSKFEEGASSSQVNTASLYPIGYERKMKCKQIEEQNTGNTFHETISLPDSFNIDYGIDFFVNPESLYDSPTLLQPTSDSGTKCTQPEADLEQTMKYVNRRRSRLLNSNISPPQKEDDFTIFPEETFHF
ncbi:uncharacterized protein [Centruroides vittatus]|uniref:uncharacterized protein n=1 Tax=Centruroides vittatus TaxID=120091 RepID=UPI00350FB1F6